MKLVTFTHHGTTRLGVVMDAHVVDLAGGAPALAKAREAAAGATAKLPLAYLHAKRRAPIANK
jgi:hypothetical protein